MTLHGDATRSAETAAADELDAALRAFHAGDPSPFAASQRRVVEALRAPLEVRPGTLFGDYRVERRIGEGGMGCVYDALELCSGRRVALKVLRRRDASIDFDPRYWQREAEALARLLHPGVTTLYRAGQVDGSYFLAMEYVEGRRIDDWARELRGTRGAVRPIVEVLASIARTVEFCHRRGVIHLDLKPANILVDRSDRAKILDFGMARLFATADFGPSDWTYDRDKAGTLPYLSPEQLDAARGDIDTRTDVHALGVVFMEILTGTRPYSSSRERPLDVVPRI
nr:serine/threonine-protein kinase [Planctomycetota bacterium]